MHGAWYGQMLQQARATSRSLKPDCCLLPTTVCPNLPPPSSFKNSCSSPTSPPWWTVLSCTGTLTQQKPLPSLLLSILFRFYSQERRGEEVVPWILEEKQLDEKYKIPGLESIWFTQSCNMAPCYLPQCTLGCAIYEQKETYMCF